MFKFCCWNYLKPQIEFFKSDSAFKDVLSESVKIIKYLDNKRFRKDLTAVILNQPEKRFFQIRLLKFSNGKN